MKISNTNIKDVKFIEPKVFMDSRGFFMETFRQNFFKENIFDGSFVQENQSKSGRGVLRGLHYQIKNPQGKLIRVVKGEIFDVAVDIRKSSKTFGKWVSAVLNDQNKSFLWIPPGFAHGFLTLSSEAEIIYKCTDYYTPEHERTIRWNDHNLNIKWPTLNTDKILVSDKDNQGTMFKNAEVFK